VIVIGCLFVFGHVAQAVEPPTVSDGPVAAQAPATSPHLIVELKSPPLSAVYKTQMQAAAVNGKLDVNAPEAQAYIAQLQAEQAVFVAEMQTVLPQARVGTFTNELGLHESNAYQITFNGLAVDPGNGDREAARELLARLPGVKGVYLDRVNVTQLYTSTSLINAPIVWNAAGGIANAGAGVKVASMDGGVHHLAPMMDGTGYVYPNGFAPNGKGLIANNNGKIITSRTYFRDWDPAAPGDQNPWPGVNGTEHGGHTASTAAGGLVNNVVYGGLNIGSMSGVAPKAYVMSYRVFYNSVTGNGSFYDAEGIAALEDIVTDGADVVNNSWGSGALSSGGAFDPLDTALINAWDAGIFVSMSAGNSGPGYDTTDHPSSSYIIVAATTTSGTLASGRISAVSVDPDLQDFPFASASFGAQPIGQTFVYTYLPSIVAGPANVLGCSAWPAGTFTGKAALIRRGTCAFGVKVLNAEQAGAEFVVVYNHAAGGDGLINMGPGIVGNQVTIASIFVGNTNGEKLVAFEALNPGTAQLEFNTVAFQDGNIADIVASFSSRGPGVVNVLKPDIAAPGVNILAQGYTPGATGEARHLGYGQASGTSMASPHVAGAAALVRQARPSWPNWAIKSALMSTAKYMDIFNSDGSPAQPLDIGAGRLDLARVLDPGVILDPPSLSFGHTPTGTVKTIAFQVTSVATATETYNLSTLYTGDSFTQTTTLPGFTVTPAALTLAPGETKTVSVTLDTAASQGLGHNQGYVLMDGPMHHAHLPAWANVGFATPLADVLIIDNDFSDGTQTYDYLWYYTSTLESLGLTYAVVAVDDSIAEPTTIPDPTVLTAYKAIVWYTGDNYNSNGDFTVSTGLTALDQDRLNAYLNNGGTLIAMGQDLAATLNADVFDPDTTNGLYRDHMGANWVQDSISNEKTPTGYIVTTASAPAALAGTVVDLTNARKGFAEGELSGANEVPSNASETSGDFVLRYDIDQNRLDFVVTVTPSSTLTSTVPITVTGAHIHLGAVGVNGPVLRSLTPLGFVPTYVTTTLTLQGSIMDLTMPEINAVLAGGTYINVHSDVYPDGEIRGQVDFLAEPNQIDVDEISNRYYNDTDAPGVPPAGNLILQYQGPFNVFDGAVAIARRAQPSLENPGIAYWGRSIYASFGLEGMNQTFNATLGYTPTTRAELLGAFLAWGASEAGDVVISNTTDVSVTGTTLFEVVSAPSVAAAAASAATAVPTQVRWDFGDGSPYVISPNNTAGHSYICSGTNIHTVRAQVTDAFGNVTIGVQDMNVSASCSNEPMTIKNQYLPTIKK